MVAHQEIDYKAPAFYADTLEISTEIIHLTNAKIEYAHKIKNQNGRLICLSKTILVCVDNRIKPKLIPEDIRKKLSK